MERDQSIKFVHELLRVMISKRASDLFITAGFPPAFKVDGKMTPVSNQSLTPTHTMEIARAVMNDKQAQEFEASKECNFAISPQGIGRFRVNAFVQQGRVGLVLRTITTTIPRFEDLGLPDVLKDVVMTKRGLVIIVGATGSGKSTTLAAMLGYRNENSYGHIITIEDPVEFEHTNQRSVIQHIEVGVDAPDFPSALRSALRQSPDVLVVGEMRDPETMKIALAAGETGHVVYSTLHTTDLPSTIARLVDSFPAERQATVRQEIAAALSAVYVQMLIPRIDAGRVPAGQLLMVGYGARQHIRKNALQHLHQEITITRKVGSFTLEECLARLVRTGVIDRQDGMARTQHVEEFEHALRG